jgi:deoxyribodipyrimidine photo-lyase
MTTIFIFRRDLRFYDNTALNKLKDTYKSHDILPIFIFNKQQIDKNKNKYYSSNSVQFLFECLDELPDINFYYTDNDISILNDLKKRFHIKAVAFNRDYTPFAIKRDKEIEQWCKSNSIDFISEEDYTLFKIGVIMKDDNKPYLKYTPFYKKAIIKKPSAINSNTSFHFIRDNHSKTLNELKFLRPTPNPHIKVNGGRKKALEILKKVKSNYFKDYDKERDYPYLDKTTKLSAYIKFGCISIREIYYSLPVKHGLVRELIWRDFYAYISFFFPHIYGSSYNKKYEKIKWDNNKTLFEKWTSGTTGFPIVDAAMRQLNTTGWLHNRCRMIVASFLTKNLFIDWRWGEQYFASKLVDYDPSSNNGGWQWSASTGTDSQPYFRIFSPSSQLEKFDKDCLYVKQWIEELRTVDNKIILNWEKNNDHNIKYPKPIVDSKETAKRFIRLFSQ